MDTDASMTIETWLETAKADAARRGLPELERMLEALARSIEAVRAADWNQDATGAAKAAPHQSAEGSRRARTD